MMLALVYTLGCNRGLDGFFFPAVRTDDYDLASDIIPANQVEEVSFDSLDGTTLYGVWIHQDEPATPLIFFHGNDTNIDVYWQRMEYLFAWGFDVFIFDYRGYGRSEGDPSYDGVIEQDGLAAARYVGDFTGVAPEDTVWWGHSLGGAVALHTNDEIGAGALMIESTFASANDMIDDGVGLDLPPGWFFADPFDNVEAISKIQSPVLIVHGLADDYVRPAYALELFAAAPDPKQLSQPEGCGHSDCPTLFPDEFRDRALAFYAENGFDPGP